MAKLPRITNLDDIDEDLKPRDVDVPEFGGSLLVWPLTGDEVEKWKAGNIRTKGGKVLGYNLDTSTARLLALALKNEIGEYQWTPSQVQKLMKRVGNAGTARLEKVARELSRLDDEDIEDGMSESEGNSDADLIGSSTSD